MGACANHLTGCIPCTQMPSPGRKPWSPGQGWMFGLELLVQGPIFPSEDGQTYPALAQGLLAVSITGGAVALR